IILLNLMLAVAAGAALLPNLTGPYDVGTTVLEIVDSTRSDPFSPTPQSRDLVVTLFYPTQSNFSENCTLAYQFPPSTAAFADSYFGLPGGTSGAFQTRACKDAPLARPDLPLLLFTPGLGAPRLTYSSNLAEIASYGWNVASVDHPYETLVVEYPDGRVVFGNPLLPSNATESEANDWYLKRLDVRVADVISVLNGLSNPLVVSRIPGFKPVSSSETEACRNVSGFRTDKIGIYGHSFGGATSLMAITNDTRFQAGINLDGSLWGSAIEEGTDVPFMIMSRPGFANNQSWAAAWPNLRGFKREYLVDGALHNSYTDLPIFRDLLGDKFPPGQDVGPITGSRMLAIVTGFVDAFFGRFLKNQERPLLDG
ncbi:Alpha/Beta hydrolase protein, partial [Bisporella sp. PMI_857]